MRVWTLMLKEKPVHRFVVHEGKALTIGRTPESDVTLDNPSISRDHALVEHEKGRDYLTDTGSTNGTFVNGKKITERTLLTANDEIRVGKFNMIAGSVGVLDVENTQSMRKGGDLHTIFVPPKNIPVAPKKKTSPDKKKSSSGLGGWIKKLFNF